MVKKRQVYAIKNGRQKGIVRTWAECEKATKGYSGAVYRSFENEQEALAWLQGKSDQGPDKVQEAGSAVREVGIEVREAGAEVAEAVDTGREAGDEGRETGNEVREAVAEGREAGDGVRGVGKALERRDPGAGVEDSGAVYDVYTDGSFHQGRYAWAYVFVKDGEIIYEENNVGKNPDAVSMRNVAGEIAAVLYAVRRAAQLGVKIRIHHDYAGIAHWVKGEWQTRNPYTQLYVDLMQKYQGVYSFVKVEAHSGNRFNEYVDKRAKEALELK